MERPRRHLVPRHAAGVDAGLAEAFAGEFHQRHAPKLPGGVGKLEQGRAVAVQKRIGGRIAPGHPLVLAAKRHRDVAEGARLIGRFSEGIEDLPTRLVEADTALHQIVGDAAFQPETRRQIIDRRRPLAFVGPRLGDQCLRVGLRLLFGLQRLFRAAGFPSLRFLRHFRLFDHFGGILGFDGFVMHGAGPFGL